MSEQQYKRLTHQDTIQAGDEFCVSIGQDRWHQYPTHMYGSPVSASLARRPIRTTQQAVDQPQRERIAYEELQVGDHIMDGDQWQNGDGRWQLFSVAPIQVREGSRVRRPYKISTILEIGDALADAQKAAAQLQNERDNALAALKSAQRARDELQLQVDELRVDRKDEPTARQVRDMLRTWAVELDWSADCFDSVSREQIDTIQKTLIAVIERVEWLCSENSNDS